MAVYDNFSPNRFQKIEDPSHSWTKVSFEFLNSIDCIDQINEFSLMDVSCGTAYIEEDDGMAEFENACFKAGVTYCQSTMYVSSFDDYLNANGIDLVCFSAEAVRKYLATAGIIAWSK